MSKRSNEQLSTAAADAVVDASTGAHRGAIEAVNGFFDQSSIADDCMCRLSELVIESGDYNALLDDLTTNDAKEERNYWLLVKLPIVICFLIYRQRLLRRGQEGDGSSSSSSSSMEVMKYQCGEEDEDQLDLIEESSESVSSGILVLMQRTFKAENDRGALIPVLQQTRSLTMEQTARIVVCAMDPELFDSDDETCIPRAVMDFIRAAVDSNTIPYESVYEYFNCDGPKIGDIDKAVDDDDHNTATGIYRPKLVKQLRSVKPEWLNFLSLLIYVAPKVATPSSVSTSEQVLLEVFTYAVEAFSDTVNWHNHPLIVALRGTVHESKKQK